MPSGNDGGTFAAPQIIQNRERAIGRHIDTGFRSIGGHDRIVWGTVEDTRAGPNSGFSASRAAIRLSSHPARSSRLSNIAISSSGVFPYSNRHHCGMITRKTRNRTRHGPDRSREDRYRSPGLGSRCPGSSNRRRQAVHTDRSSGHSRRQRAPEPLVPGLVAPAGPVHPALVPVRPAQAQQRGELPMRRDHDATPRPRRDAAAGTSVGNRCSQRQLTAPSVSLSVSTSPARSASPSAAESRWCHSRSIR